MDDREREIAELRKRLDTLEGKQQPPPGIEPQTTPPAQRAVEPRPVGLRTLLIVGAVFLAGLISISLLNSRPETPAGVPEKKDTAPAETASAPCDQGRAEKIYNAGLKTGLIRGAEVSRDEGFVVIVQEQMWNRLSFREQQATAAALDCGIAGPGKDLKAMHFRANRSGSDLYGLEAYDLLKLREAGLAGSALTTALEKHRVKAEAEDRAADAAKSSGGGWSGSAAKAQAGDLEAGQDLTNPERAGLASYCRQVAKAPIATEFIRVDAGGATPRFTCKLASGGTVKVRIDSAGDPHRIP